MRRGLRLSIFTIAECELVRQTKRVRQQEERQIKKEKKKKKKKLITKVSVYNLQSIYLQRGKAFKVSDNLGQ